MQKFFHFILVCQAYKVNGKTLQRVKKSFCPAVRFSELSSKVLRTCFIERERDFLPLSHFPRCSITEVFSGFFDSLTLTLHEKSHKLKAQEDLA